MKLNQALIGASALLLVSSAFATDITGGADAEGDITGTNTAQNHTYTAGTDGYVRTNFTFSTSANVDMKTVESGTAVAVGTASAKGRNAFTGSSDGGSVGACGEATTGSTEPTVPTPDLTAAGGCATTGS